MSQQGSAAGKPSAGQWLQVLVFSDLIVYGLAYISPVGPFSTWGYASVLSGGAAPLSYALAAAVLLVTALSYATMAKEIPGSGSAYAYARSSMGEVAGFMTGWMILLDYLLLPALMYVFFAISMAAIFPEVPRWVWIVGVAAYNIGVNWFGIKTSARFNFATLIGQFFVLFVVIAWALYKMKESGIATFTTKVWWGPESSMSGLFAATSLCMMAYLGFDAITTLTGEVRPEQRHLVGRAVPVTLAIVAVLAVLQVWIFADLAAGFEVKDPASITFDLLGARVDPLLGQGAAIAAALIIALSITPTMVIAVSRVLQSMASNGEMPRFLAHMHPKYKIPDHAVLVSGVLSIAVAIVFAEHFDALTSMVNFGALLAFIAVNASVIAFRRKLAQGGFFSHVVLPVIGIVSLVAVLTQMNLTGLTVGSGWLALGFVVCVIFRTRGTKLVEPSGG